MCVIICIENGIYPSKTTLEDAEMMNSHGGSIAWLDLNGKKHYQKGIKAKRINKIINKQLKPNGIKTAIIHFRIASVGTVNKLLCHPFEITNRVELRLSGDDMNADLLFHNGTWSDYAEEMLIFLSNIGKPLLIPQGEYSDSRVMAYLAKHLGVKQMAKLVTGWNKIAILTSHGIDKYGSGWVDVKGNKCSNDYFINDGNMWTWAKAKSPVFNSVVGVNDVSYLNEVEKQVIKDIKTEYDITDDEINGHLDFGFSVYDIESMLENESYKYAHDIYGKRGDIEDEIQYNHDSMWGGTD